MDPLDSEPDAARAGERRSDANALESLAAACADTRARARAFLTGSPDAPAGAAARRMREHLAACPACDAAYRAEAEFVAQLGRENRRTRERKGVPRRGRASRFLTLPAPRKTRLRLVLIPAFAIFLMTQSDRLRSQAGWRVEALEGPVVAEGESVPATESSRRLTIGETCSTGERGRAVLRLGDTRLVLGPRTDLVLGSESERSVRFAGGELTVGGPCRLQAALALVDVGRGSSARVASTDPGLRIECLTGSLRVQDVTGTRSLVVGEAFTR